MGFKGTYLNKFDEAGRISLPAKMRDELKGNSWGNHLVVYYAFKTGCLKIVPGSVFKEMEQGYLQNPPKNEKAAKAFRAIFSSSDDIEVNSSGRISISAKHRTKANLGDECYIIGVNDKIEIWNKDAWETEIAKFEEEFSEDNEDFGDNTNCMLF